MKIEPQMDRLHGGNNHKSFTVREAVWGDKRRQSRCSIGITARLQKTRVKGWFSLLKLSFPGVDKEYFFIAFTAVKTPTYDYIKESNHAWRLEDSTVHNMPQCTSCTTARRLQEIMKYKWSFWSMDYNIMAQTIKINFITCLTVSWKKEQERERERWKQRESKRQGSRICVDFHSGGRYLVFLCGPCHIYCIKVRVFICSKSAFSLSPLLHVINAGAMSLSDLWGLQAWLTVMTA